MTLRTATKVDSVVKHNNSYLKSMDVFAEVLLWDTRTVLVACLVFLVVYLSLYSRDRRYHLPPGPPVLPVVGTMYAHSISMRGFLRAREVYGDAVTLYVGPIRAVMLNTYDVIKEAAVTKASAFSDRGVHVSYCISHLNPNLKGVINRDYDERLRQNRSETLTILRNLGVGRSSMEEKILQETVTLREVFAEKQGKSFDPWHMISCSVVNVILYITVNRRLEHRDPELLELVRYTDGVIKAGNRTPFIDVFRFLKNLPPFSATYQRLCDGDRGMRNFMWRYARQLTDNFELGYAANFVDCWLGNNFSEVTKKAILDEEDFLYILRDFLLAGSETTTTSLKWTILFAANRRDVQERAYSEIERVVGSSRPVRLSDRESLPYLEALILEIQRFNTILPGGLPHYCKADSKIGKYDIPANTIVSFNLHAVHMDKGIFGDPQVFRPERFLDDSGRFVKHPRVIPFAIGKRSCLGELLARQELFLFTASLLQNFKFLPPEGTDRIDDKSVVGFTNCPKPFKVRALPR